MKRLLFFLAAVLPSFFFCIPETAAQGSQTVSNGTPTIPIHFPSGCVFTWVNNTASIGLPASGTGDIAPFTAINTGSVPITATLVATPPIPIAYIANATDGAVSAINSASNSVIATIPVAPGPFAVTVSPDGNYIYVTGTGYITVISSATNTVIASIPIGTADYVTLLVSHDGSRLYASDIGSENVRVFNTATYALIATIPVGAAPGGLVLSPDGSSLYVVNQDDATLSQINTATNTVTATFSTGTGTYPSGIAISQYGDLLYVANSGSNTVSIINTYTQAVVATVPVGSIPVNVAITPGAFAYVPNEGDNTISVISLVSQRVVATIPTGTRPFGLSVLPGGSEIYFTNASDGTVSVINTATNIITATFPVGGQPFSFGNFFDGPCGITPTTYTIIVNPSPVIWASVVTGSIVACVGSASTNPDIQTFSVSGTWLVNDIIATAPAGFEISLDPDTGFGNNITLPQTSGAVTNTKVYVRSAAPDAAGSPTGNVLLSSENAANQNLPVSATINATLAPTVGITASSTAICAGTPVTFKVNVTNGGATPIYHWMINGNAVFDNTNTFTTNTLKEGDMIDCAVTGSLGCATPALSPVVKMLVNPLPTVLFIPDTIFITGSGGVQLDPLTTGSIMTYQWSPGAGLSATGIADPLADPATNITYRLLVRTDSGCTATGNITVSPRLPLLMPNGFTPNGDGHNDIFRIPASAPILLEEFLVFDRLGAEVFSTRDANTGWDGMDHGVPAAVGTYVYMIRGKSLTGKTILLKGTVALIR